MSTEAAAVKKYTILVVDDLPQNLDVMKGILLPEYDVRVTTKPKSVMAIAKAIAPDIILLDIMMPELNGYQVCQQLKAEPATAHIPIIFVTAMTEVQDEQRGFDLGAVDYITKPVVESIVKARVHTHLLLSDQTRAAQQLVKQRTAELEQIQRSAIYMLGEAGHYNDNDTGVHIWRMAAYSAALARAALWNVERAKLIELAAPMHDTGKIGISDDILKAPRKLTEQEMIIMRSHAYIGYKILSKSQTPLFNMAADIALHHHERWDGTGYPKQLVAEQIPESARIVAIADVFDALTMKRPYKQSWPVEDAFDYIEQHAGSHFEPRLVDCFLSIKAEILAIKQQYDDFAVQLD